MSALAYQSLVYVHLLLFVAWLGADAGVFIAGQHFRRRAAYTLDQRVALLKLLVAIDMVPRTAWALMVPVSLTLAASGGMLLAPPWLTPLAWALGLVWLWLVWDSHLHEGTPRAARARRAEFALKLAIMAFYLALGIVSLARGEPIGLPWLAWKALLFGAIFAVAIMIDVKFKPVVPHLERLIAEGSSDATERPLRAAMDGARLWVFALYGLLLVIAWLGVAQP